MIIKMAVNGYFGKLEEAYPIDGGSIDQSKLKNLEMRGTRTSWRFIADLTSVERHDIDSDSIPPADDYDHFFLSVSEHVKGDNRVWIEAQQSAAGNKSLEVCIVSDMEVYLLNDNGKTIERLN